MEVEEDPHRNLPSHSNAKTSGKDEPSVPKASPKAPRRAHCPGASKLPRVASREASSEEDTPLPKAKGSRVHVPTPKPRGGKRQRHQCLHRNQTTQLVHFPTHMHQNLDSRRRTVPPKLLRENIKREHTEQELSPQRKKAKLFILKVLQNVLLVVAGVGVTHIRQGKPVLLWHALKRKRMSDLRTKCTFVDAKGASAPDVMLMLSLNLSQFLWTLPPPPDVPCCDPSPFTPGTHFSNTLGRRW
ncbi:hypothetical protein P4O66_001308 [Electrophorus voltai]|uniref:Uncharacterized protein n=1 Tax=Electrophorus voltai TaxID=2609070 RepID=A0AAD8Z8R8_9TELE|nr:hypothetical protein P4O66_001308 [Electrophorus voltai]